MCTWHYGGHNILCEVYEDQVLVSLVNLNVSLHVKILIKIHSKHHCLAHAYQQSLRLIGKPLAIRYICNRPKLPECKQKRQKQKCECARRSSNSCIAPSPSHFTLRRSIFALSLLRLRILTLSPSHSRIFALKAKVRKSK